MNHEFTITITIVIAFLTVFFASTLRAAEPARAPRLPAIFGDNMVLQSGQAAPVWGWAAPGQKVTVKIAGQEKIAQADAAGKWLVKLDSLKAGGPLEMTVAGEAEITIRNILVGEVWLCSGQSNMGTGVGASIDGLREIRDANFPKIRIFAAPMQASPDKPAADISAPWGCYRAKWLECGPETIGPFPAVGYFFARKIHKELGTPVGMIQSVWGGTGQEAWLSREGFQSDPEFKPLLQRTDDWLAKEFPKARAKHQAEMSAYEKLKDPIEVTNDEGWDAAKLDESAWKGIDLPGPAKMNGVAWFRRTAQLPPEWGGKDLKISFGGIGDNDVTYVNGVKVGGVNEWDAPREYDVPAALVKDGRAVIAVRAEGFGGGTGPGGQPQQMSLAPVGVKDAKPLSLAGAWKYRVAIVRPILPLTLDCHVPPGAVYNGMIAPLAGFGIRGVLWYQGETGGFHYGKLFPAMIRDWRKHWGQGDFPFLYVQLPNLNANNNAGIEESWVNVREAQLKALALPNTGMAVTIDVGDPMEVHYRNKQPVGLRLALWALAKVYGRDIVYSGPLYDSAKVEGGKMRIKFRNIGGGLVVGQVRTSGGAPNSADRQTGYRVGLPVGAAGPSTKKDSGNQTHLQQFQIAGADRKFVPAAAVIDGDSVLVWSDKVAEPAAVRYAWLCNPEGCNLYNKEGLPASPFRTDDWPWKKP